MLAPAPPLVLGADADQDAAMDVTRIFTGDDGQSHFEDVAIELIDCGDIGMISEPWPGSGVMFREVNGDYNYDFHNAPRRQIVVNLDGWVEIELGDGSTRRFGPGSVILAEDVSGQGHISRAIEGKPRRCLLVPLD